MFTQQVHPESAQDLNVVVTLPEEFIGKDVEISAIPVQREPSIDDQIADDPFWKWVDSLNIQRGDWKFNRDEANER